jgi:hypothetical protein
LWCSTYFIHLEKTTFHQNNCPRSLHREPLASRRCTRWVSTPCSQSRMCGPSAPRSPGSAHPHTLDRLHLASPLGRAQEKKAHSKRQGVHLIVMERLAYGAYAMTSRRLLAEGLVPHEPACGGVEPIHHDEVLGAVVHDAVLG